MSGQRLLGVGLPGMWQIPVYDGPPVCRVYDTSVYNRQRGNTEACLQSPV